MAASSCIRCGKPFPANQELSALPLGRRIAWDPDRNRAWRICIECGEWNLLSQDDSALVLPEVNRLATILPTEALDQGVSRFRTGLLEILRIGVSPGSLRNPGVEERHAKVVRRQKQVAIFGIVSLAAVLTMPWWFTQGIRYIVALCGTLWSAQLVGRIPRVRRLKLGTGRTELAFGAVLLGMAVVASAGGQELRVLLTSWLALTPIWVWMDSGLPFGRTKLPSGGTVWIRRRELDETRLSLDTDDNIVLTLPSGRLLDIEDSAAVLRDLLDGYSWETTAQAQKLAATLVQEVEPLEAIVEILRPALEAETDGLPLIRLPSSWRAALDLALAADSGVPGRLTALATKAREAQQVAEIAESLDRGD
jgi:hypothetical protein